jgi:hypothetical protein
VYTLKKCISFIKPFFLAPAIIYIFNKMAVIIDVFIPFNIFTILIVGVFDIMGLILLIVIYFIVI